MSRNRIIYNSQALYCSQVDSISSQLSSGTVEQLYRVQSFDESFELNYTNVMQFGNLAQIDTLLLENPVIEGGFSYYLGDGLNEKLLGFDIANPQNPQIVSCISGILLKKSDHKNYYLSIIEGNDDANSQTRPNVARGGSWTTPNTGVVAIGNAFIKNYKREAGVESITIVNVDIQSLNLKVYKKLENKNPLPSIDIDTDTVVKDKFYTMQPGRTNKYTDQLSALNPGDIIFKIPGPLGFDTNDLKIQNVTLDINFDRGQTQKIGARYPISRELNFPIVATLDIDADAGDLTSGSLNQIFCSKPTNDFSIIFNKTSCNVDNSPPITYFFKDARLISESFSSSFGSSSSINLKYEVQFDSPNNLNRGIFISGTYITPIIEECNIWVSRSINKNWTDVAISSDGKYQTAVAQGGQIYISSDYGNSWTAKEDFRSWRSVSMSSDGKCQSAVAGINNAAFTDSWSKIWVSTDYGNTWSIRYPIGYSNMNFTNIAVSSGGKYQTVIHNAYDGRVFYSIDSGSNWNASVMNFYMMPSTGVIRLPKKIAIAGNEQIQYISKGWYYDSPEDYIVSYNNGATWSNYTNDFSWTVIGPNTYGTQEYGDCIGIATNNDGSIINILTDGYMYGSYLTGSNIYVSKNYGTSWSAPIQPMGQKSNLKDISISSDGKYQITAGVTFGLGQKVSISYDYGNTWKNQNLTSQTWSSVAISNDGNYRTATVYGPGPSYGGQIYINNMDCVYPPELIFTPIDIPYLVSWYSSDYGVYNTVDNLATENQSVSIWKNKITNGPDVSAPLNLQPDFSSTGISFSYDMMSGNNKSPLNAPLNYYIATRTPLSGLNTYNIILKQGTNQLGSNTRYAFMVNSNGQLGVGNPTYNPSNLTMSTGKNIIACIFSDIANAVLRNGNVSEAINMGGGSNALSQFIIGSNSSSAASSQIQGSIYEILVYTGIAHNNDQQNQIIDYLSKKWGIPL